MCPHSTAPPSAITQDRGAAIGRDDPLSSQEPALAGLRVGLLAQRSKLRASRTASHVLQPACGITSDRTVMPAYCKY